MRGCLEWQRAGLAPPAAVADATDDYKSESDSFATFLTEACELTDDTSEVRAADLFIHYRTWADQHGMTDRERLNSTAFGRKAGERLKKEKRPSGTVYLGVARR